MAQRLKTIGKMFCIVCIASVVGLLLLVLVYMLPIGRISTHILESTDLIQRQNDTSNLQSANFYYTYDTDTNIIIFLEAEAIRNGTVVEDAINVPCGDYLDNQWGNWVDTLKEYATYTSVSQGNYVTYARYWHGYLIFLKPLLQFLNVQEIYYLNAMCMICLSLLICYLMYKELGRYVIAYISTLFAMNPFFIMESVQLSTIFYAMQITLALLLTIGKRNSKTIPYIFLVDGILVAYFDFLTYPVVAFGIPVLTYILLYRNDLLKNLIEIIKQASCFLMGYAGMWVTKWIWATVLTGSNIIQDGIDNVLHRTGNGARIEDTVYGMTISPKAAIVTNIKAFVCWPTVIVGGISVIIIIYILIKNKRSLKIECMTTIICVLVASFPFIWYVVLDNHASLHPHLEWRELAVSFYAMLVCFLSMGENLCTKIEQKK